MNIAASVHLYPPRHNCGGEYYLHNILKNMTQRGHSCKVLLHEAGKYNIQTPYQFEGIDVIGGTAPQKQTSYLWADVVLTHLDYTHFTIIMARSVNKPVVHLVHNDTPYTSVQNSENNYVVYNSEWIAKKLNYNKPFIVFPPPVDYDRFNVNSNPNSNEYITLINLDVNKGGHLLRGIALRMPERKFLGVKGSYSWPSTIGQITDQPDNVVIIENTTDILSVYRKTRILLVLSAFESWGMVASEALCSGIPVICTPTPGLRENCGDAAIYVPGRDSKFLDKEKIDEYDVSPVVEAIKQLDDKNYYSMISRKVRERAKRKNNFDALENFLMNAANHN